MKHIIETEMKENRARGMQRMKMLDWMKEKLNFKINIVKDREKW